MDKLTIAALGATLAEKLRRPERRSSGGLDLQLQQAPRQRNKAEQLLQMLQHAQPTWTFELLELEGSFGGGSCPDQTIPGWAVGVRAPVSAEELDKQLRHKTPAILGLKHKGMYCLHVGALLPGDAESIASRVKEL
jgi:seryl-tRNA(Sec) selenium transferase